uniref:ZP-C domain-containing protein n=1 Tax=Erpetoichthys calabaricus TaxID=27687 RepID=A0A8C4T759_ERPCA
AAPIRGCQIIFIHIFLSSSSCSVTPITFMSPLITSINLLLDPPLLLFPGSSILSTLLPIYPSSLLCIASTWESKGPFDVELCIATDPSFSSYCVDADYPVAKTLKDVVAVEVHIVNRADPDLVLTHGACWLPASPTGAFWLMACLERATQVINKRSVDPVDQQAMAGKIFIYCVAAACYPSATDLCTQSCPSRRSGIASSRKNVLLHGGPVVLEGLTRFTVPALSALINFNVFLTLSS